nr:MAG TPA: hypothetical protein [Bacteriophage sp.]
MLGLDSFSPLYSFIKFSLKVSTTGASSFQL